MLHTMVTLDLFDFEALNFLLNSKHSSFIFTLCFQVRIMQLVFQSTYLISLKVNIVKWHFYFKPRLIKDPPALSNQDLSLKVELWKLSTQVEDILYLNANISRAEILWSIKVT